jgi:hypothetical protein
LGLRISPIFKGQDVQEDILALEDGSVQNQDTLCNIPGDNRIQSPHFLYDDDGGGGDDSNNFSSY